MKKRFNIKLDLFINVPSHSCIIQSYGKLSTKTIVFYATFGIHTSITIIIIKNVFVTIWKHFCLLLFILSFSISWHEEAKDYSRYFY